MTDQRAGWRGAALLWIFVTAVLTPIWILGFVPRWMAFAILALGITAIGWFLPGFSKEKRP